MIRDKLLPECLWVLVRGWLHGNVVLLRGARPALFDSGYHTGVADVALRYQRFAGQPLATLPRLYLTHVHSDHAGGCAELKRTSGCQIFAHEKCRDLVRRWDRRGLWLAGTQQFMPQFAVDRVLTPGDGFAAGDLGWEVIELGGHATGGLGFWAAQEGLLVAGDALWERGLGGLNPGDDGEQVFAQALAALDTIAALPVKVVVPGHGPPFTDVEGALGRAYQRVARWRDDRELLTRDSLRGLVAFWLLDQKRLDKRRFLHGLSEIAASLDLPCDEVAVEGFFAGLKRAAVIDMADNGIGLGERVRA